MGFGYKTAWLATASASPDAVADALDLRQRRLMPWREGTEAAYTQGIFVARPVRPIPSWTLAHSRVQLPPGFPAYDARFPAWLRRLSSTLGEVQYFLNDRVGGHYAWARAVDGEITRAYYFGDMTVLLRIGEPTDVEHELGVVQGVPYEKNVLQIAQRWSVSPDDIPNESVTDPGIHGLPPDAQDVVGQPN